jgi:hypothetical protein
MSLGLGEFKKLLKLAGVGSGGGGSGPVTPPGQTLRNIATRCRQNYQTYVTTTALASYSRTLHTNRGDDVSSVQVVHGNWYANNVQEFNVSVAATYYVGIEYPAGTFTLAEWSTATGTPHATAATCASGANVTTDAIPVEIPSGAQFWVRTYIQYASAINVPCSANATTTGQESNMVVWTGAQTNDPRAVVTGAATSGSAATGSFAVYPLAVLGMSSVPSVICYGDSRLSGRADSAAATNGSGASFGKWGLGEVCRSLDSARPYMNCGCETDTIQNFNLSHTLRAGLAQYHTHVHFEYGINDLTAGRTAAVIQTALQAGYALFPTKKISQSTIPPVTASTDAWATLANQTPAGTNAQRILLNNWIRSKPSPLWNAFEVADVVESARDSGLWKTPTDSAGITAAVTGDGTHETPYGYGLIQNSGAINPTLFV